LLMDVRQDWCKTFSYGKEIMSISKGER